MQGGREEKTEIKRKERMVCGMKRNNEEKSDIKGREGTDKKRKTRQMQDKNNKHNFIISTESNKMESKDNKD